MSHKYSNLKHIVERAIGSLRGNSDASVQAAVAELEAEIANPSEGDLAAEPDHKKSKPESLQEADTQEEETEEVEEETGEVDDEGKPKKVKKKVAKKKK